MNQPLVPLVVRIMFSLLWALEVAGRFTNIALVSGITQALESTQGTWADVDGDGRLDLFVTHNAGQGNFIYRNLGLKQANYYPKWRECCLYQSASSNNGRLR